MRYTQARTFQPVRVDTIEDHIMHPNMPRCRKEVVDAVLAAKARAWVIAVGTTSARLLESAAQQAAK